MIYAALAMVLFAAPLLAVLGHDLIVNRQMVHRRGGAPPKVYVVLTGEAWGMPDVLEAFAAKADADAAQRNALEYYERFHIARDAWVKELTVNGRKGDAE